MTDQDFFDRFKITEEDVRQGRSEARVFDLPLIQEAHRRLQDGGPSRAMLRGGGAVAFRVADVDLMDGVVTILATWT